MNAIERLIDLPDSATVHRKILLSGRPSFSSVRHRAIAISILALVMAIVVVSCGGNSGSNGQWDARGVLFPQSPTRNTLAQSVTCVEPDYCVADNMFSYFRLSNNESSWDQVRMPDPPFGAITCTLSQFCATIVGQGSSVATESKTGAIHLWRNIFLGIKNSLDMISCASADLCMAADGSGYIVAFNGQHWSRPLRLAPAIIVGLSCPLQSFCLAADLSGDAYYFNGSNWHLGPSLPAHQRFIHASCVSSSDCWAVSYPPVNNPVAVRYVYNGKLWNYNSLYSESVGVSQCLTGSLCYGWSHNVLNFLSSGVWGGLETIAPNAYVPFVSCTQLRFCVAIDAHGHWFVRQGRS